MLFSCNAHVIHAHTTLYLPFFYNKMFTSLDRLLPHRAGDYLAPGSDADVSFAFALSVLESRGITQGSLVVLERNALTLPQLITHVVQESDESATLSVLCRKTNLCACAALSPVLLRVEFQLQLSDMVARLKRHRLDRSSPNAPARKNSSIRVKCFHCEALKTITISSNRLVAIPSAPSAPVYVGWRALIAAGFCGDKSRYNYCFDRTRTPIYLLPSTESKVHADPSRMAVDLTDANQPPDVGSLSVWHVIRNSVGPGAKYLRDVTSTFLITRYGPAGPWAFRFHTHGSEVPSTVRVYRDGSCLVVSYPGRQLHLRLQCDGIALTAACIEELAAWHRHGAQTNSAAFMLNATPDSAPPVSVKVEEEDADPPPSPLVTSTCE
jgi:hypothetical protein